MDDFLQIKIISVGEKADNAISKSLANGLEHIETVNISPNKGHISEDTLECLRGIDMAFIVSDDTTDALSKAIEVAKASREMGVLTIGVLLNSVVLSLTDWERKKSAELAKFEGQVDVVFGVPHDKLQPLVKSIFDLTATPGLINLDFADVKYIFSKVGYALMGVGMSSGENMYADAVQEIMKDTVISNEIKRAGSILLNFAGSEDCLNMFAISKTTVTIQELAHPDANIIFGATIDNTLAENISVTVIITRLDVLNYEADKSAEPVGTPVLC